MSRWRRSAVYALTAAALLSPDGASAGTGPDFSLHSEARFEARAGGVNLVNVTYEVGEIDLGEGHRHEHVVFEQRVDSDQPWESDAYNTTITVTARVLAAGRFNKPLWSFRETAAEASIHWPYYRSTVSAYDADEEPLYRFRSPASGKVLFVATTEPARVDWHEKGTEQFHNLSISYVSDHTPQDLAFKKRHPDAFGLIVMQLEDKVLDRVVLTRTAENKAMEGWSPKLGLVDRRHPDATAGDDGWRELGLLGRPGPLVDQLWDGFDLCLRYDKDIGRPLITIPVRSGRFDLSAIKLPKGVVVARDMGKVPDSAN